MATITSRFLPLRLNTHPVFRPIPHHFSTPSPSDPSIPPAECQTQPSFSSNFEQVKASLREQQPKNRPCTLRGLVPFSDPTPTQAPASKIAPLEEIRHKLAEFRLRSFAPPPSGSSGKFISFQELYKRNVISTPYDSEKTFVGPEAGGRLSYGAIRESLRQLRATAPAPAPENRHDSTGKAIDPISLARFKDNFKLQASGSVADSPTITVGSGRLPSSILGTGKENDGNDTGTELVKLYDYSELGMKLGLLRPEKRKGKWFSLQELNERLVKLRKIEEEEKELMVQGVTFKDIEGVFVEGAAFLLRLDILGSLGETQSFMDSPPKEYLVEKYFHPDNMSASEKLKLELERVRAEFKTSESDCGSARIQVAQLTTKIKHLSTVLHKKDKHSRKGIQAMVQRRKKLLKYLRRTDWDSYSMVLSKLSLRDNPDTKA
ncbi:uncharacterized protein [Primulina eburnea]|uniref:uncharacterized protein n=1 Tax=Primulina eburnea TaxID=1245227 RepID=UPI003C6C58E8